MSRYFDPPDKTQSVAKKLGVRKLSVKEARDRACGTPLTLIDVDSFQVLIAQMIEELTDFCFKRNLHPSIAYTAMKAWIKKTELMLAKVPIDDAEKQLEQFVAEEWKELKHV
jgi:hypothetical protein